MNNVLSDLGELPFAAWAGFGLFLGCFVRGINPDPVPFWAAVRAFLTGSVFGLMFCVLGYGVVEVMQWAPNKFLFAFNFSSFIFHF